MTALGQDKPGTSVCPECEQAGEGGRQGRELSLDFGSKCGKKGEAVARRCLVVLCWVPAAPGTRVLRPTPGPPFSPPVHSPLEHQVNIP